MLKLIEVLIVGILTSFFYFPVEFVVLPGINTKMMLAVAGLAFAAFELVKRRSLSLSAEFLTLLLFASAVSIASLLSITINQTPDTTYVTYIVSFLVWLFGAFAVCCIIKGIHGRIEVQLVLDYLVAVCVFQCIVSLLIDNVIPVRLFVDRIFELDQSLIHEIHRLYGIGASLDVAGMRFALVLSAMGFYISGIGGRLSKSRQFLYILAFLILSVIGNMIARTSTAGMMLGLILIIIGLFTHPEKPEENRGVPSWTIWAVLIAVGITISVNLYNSNPDARRLFRFAFEGFFSLAEKGRWETASGNSLQMMFVWPESLHTWVIGDGYFMNSRYDPNYLGDATDKGYYMMTDVGYLRFLYYFGLAGLIPIMLVIIYSSVVCMRCFREERILFFAVMLVGLIVWVKVSSDIFCFLALFLSAAALQEPGEDLSTKMPDA